jgi:zinc/manganese transport system permease protein
VFKASVLYAFIGGLHFLFWKKFINLSYGNGRSFLWEFLFFLTFAFVLVSSVQLAGILQVFSFLVIPALIGRLYTENPIKILLRGWLIGVGVSLFGVSLSYRLDIPTAPLIVASLSMIFFFLLGLKSQKTSHAGVRETMEEETQEEKSLGRSRENDRGP